MTKYLFLVLLSPLFVFAQNPEMPKVELEGIWELESFYYYENNEITDSARLWGNYRQVKMFQDGSVMWTRMVPKDSVEWYGFGTFEIRNDSLIERLDYGSHELMKLFDPVHAFEIEMGVDYFRQIDHDQYGNRKTAENYRRIRSSSSMESKKN